MRGTTRRSAAFGTMATILIATLLGVPPAAAQTGGAVIHVDQAATGSGDGTSWDDAHTDLQTALAAAVPGDTVELAQGTYVPSATDPSASFVIPDGVSVVGGYATGGGAGPDPDLYPTVLSGDLAGDDAPDQTNRADNSINVVTVDSTVTTTAGLVGVRVTAAAGDGVVLTQTGALAILDAVIDDHGLNGIAGSNGELSIIDSTLTANNQNGILLHSRIGPVVLRNSSFTDNAVGGYQSKGGGDLTVANSEFLRNGGVGFFRGIADFGSTTDISGSEFANNGSDGLVISTTGGVRITDSEFVDNGANGLHLGTQSNLSLDGLFVARNGDAGIRSVQNGISLADSTIADNRGPGFTDEGGLSFAVDRVVIIDNDDGGVSLSRTGRPDNPATIADSLIAGNHSDSHAGGIGVSRSNVEVVNTTVAGNSSTVATGGIDFGDAAFGASGPAVRNSIVWGNGPGPNLTISGTETVTVEHSDVAGWTGGNGNIDTDPQFRGTGDFRLTNASPAREAGDDAAVVSSIDLDGLPRIDGAVDMGAYETPGDFDSFDDPGILAGASGTRTATNTGATSEPGEPNRSCGGTPDPLNSLWFSWTAPDDMRVQFDTVGSSIDTYLHAYTGTEIDALTEIECNDDADGTGTTESAFWFDATAGTEYHIQVDGYAGATGDLTLTWGPVAELTIGNFVANPEGDSGETVHEITVTLDAPAVVDITVDWATLGLTGTGLATRGVDFAAASGTLVIPAGATTAAVPIVVYGDEEVDPPLLWGEWGVVMFDDPDAATVGESFFGGGLFIIIDDD